MPSARRAVLLVAAVFLWWSAAGALADGNGTVCLCTGPQCVPPCPVPGTPPTTSPTQFPFCPLRPPAIGPFPWEQQPPAAPRSGFPQDAGFLAAAAASPSRAAAVAAWLAVAAACSAFLLLLQ